jgi:hypothetical protein
MDRRLLFGVVLPLLFIFVLVLLGNASIGFSVERETEKSVQFDSLFVSQSHLKSNVPIQTVTLNNDFFMPRKFELPRLVICLNDKEGNKAKENIRVKYSEGTYTKGSDVPIFDEIFFDYYSYSRHSIELLPYSKKQVQISVEPKSLYDYDKAINTYKVYDELLLIELKDGPRYLYNVCGDLGTEELDSAVHITILE